MEIAFFSVIVTVAVVLQTWATLRLRKSPSFAAEQKSVQMKLIWLVPVLGAAMVLSILHQDGELFPKKPGTTQQQR